MGNSSEKIDQVQEVKNRTDIVAVIGRFVELKKAGVLYKGNCPFHSEHTPSFVVTPAKQIWHCFGCDRGGDVFSFLMEHEHVTFKDALEQLADSAGITLEQYHNPVARQAKETQQLLIRINEFTAALYQQTLLNRDGTIAQNYLAKRGLNPATITQWGIGYAPDQYEYLVGALKKKNISLELAATAGVIGKNARAGYYDKFRGRITFPIHSPVGNIVGFSARILNAQNHAAKYINTSDSPVYRKGEILFGYDKARQSIQKLGAVVVVEGQMDCITAHQAGFTNTIATSGTALTDMQLKLLQRLCNTLIFSFDADTAGQNAQYKAVQLALSLGFQVKVIQFSTTVAAKDPDELIREMPNKWKQLVEHAAWAIDAYLLHAAEQYQSGSVEQKQYIQEKIIPLVGSMADSFSRDHYARKISEQFLISESVITEAILRYEKKLPQQVDTTTHTQLANLKNLTLEKQIFAAAFAFPDMAVFLKDQLWEEIITHTELRSLLTDFFESRLSPEQLSNSTVAAEAQFMLELEQQQNNFNQLAYIRQLQKSAYILRLHTLKERMQELSFEIKNAESQKNKIILAQLQNELSRLISLRADLEQLLTHY